MVLCLKLKKQLGEPAKRWLSSKGWLNKDHILGKTANYLIIPLNEKADRKQILEQFHGAFEEKHLQKINRQSGTLSERLSALIPKGKADAVIRSFDVVGDIAILDIPDELAKLEKSIAWALRQAHPTIKTIAKRASLTDGEYRIRQIKVIDGRANTETIHKESGLRFKLDLNKTYFSSRQGSERLRIANQVKKGERVLVMFAGVGPFALVIAKQQPNVKEIVGVELNKDASDYFEANIRLNAKAIFGADSALMKATERIKSVNGDARKVVPALGKFDRIVMPLPKQAESFLDVAFKAAKRGAIIHLYQFFDEDEADERGRKVVLDAARKARAKVKILKIVRCGAYSPRVYRVCVDFKVL